MNNELNQENITKTQGNTESPCGEMLDIVQSRIDKPREQHSICSTEQKFQFNLSTPIPENSSNVTIKGEFDSHCLKNRTDASQLDVTKDESEEMESDEGSSMSKVQKSFTAEIVGDNPNPNDNCVPTNKRMGLELGDPQFISESLGIVVDKEDLQGLSADSLDHSDMNEAVIKDYHNSPNQENIPRLNQGTYCPSTNDDERTESDRESSDEEEGLKIWERCDGVEGTGDIEMKEGTLWDHRSSSGSSDDDDDEVLLRIWQEGRHNDKGRAITHDTQMDEEVNEDLRQGQTVCDPESSGSKSSDEEGSLRALEEDLCDKTEMMIMQDISMGEVVKDESKQEGNLSSDESSNNNDEEVMLQIWQGFSEVTTHDIQKKEDELKQEKPLIERKHSSTSTGSSDQEEEERLRMLEEYLLEDQVVSHDIQKEEKVEEYELKQEGTLSVCYGSSNRGNDEEEEMLQTESNKVKDEEEEHLVSSVGTGVHVSLCDDGERISEKNDKTVKLLFKMELESLETSKGKKEDEKEEEKEDEKEEDEKEEGEKEEDRKKEHKKEEDRKKEHEKEEGELTSSGEETREEEEIISSEEVRCQVVTKGNRLQRNRNSEKYSKEKAKEKKEESVRLGRSRTERKGKDSHETSSKQRDLKKTSQKKMFVAGTRSEDRHEKSSRTIGENTGQERQRLKSRSINEGNSERNVREYDGKTEGKRDGDRPRSKTGEKVTRGGSSSQRSSAKKIDRRDLSLKGEKKNSPSTEKAACQRPLKGLPENSKSVKRRSAPSDRGQKTRETPTSSANKDKRTSNSISLTSERDKDKSRRDLPKTSSRTENERKPKNESCGKKGDLNRRSAPDGKKEENKGKDEEMEVLVKTSTSLEKVDKAEEDAVRTNTSGKEKSELGKRNEKNLTRRGERKNGNDAASDLASAKKDLKMKSSGEASETSRLEKYLTSKKEKERYPTSQKDRPFATSTRSRDGDKKSTDEKKQVSERNKKANKNETKSVKERESSSRRSSDSDTKHKPKEKAKIRKPTDGKKETNGKNKGEKEQEKETNEKNKREKQQEKESSKEKENTRKHSRDTSDTKKQLPTEKSSVRKSKDAKKETNEKNKGEKQQEKESSKEKENTRKHSRDTSDTKKQLPTEKSSVGKSKDEKKETNEKNKGEKEQEKENSKEKENTSKISRVSSNTKQLPSEASKIRKCTEVKKEEANEKDKDSKEKQKKSMKEKERNSSKLSRDRTTAKHPPETSNVRKPTDGQQKTNKDSNEGNRKENKSTDKKDKLKEKRDDRRDKGVKNLDINTNPLVLREISVKRSRPRDSHATAVRPSKIRKVGKVSEKEQKAKVKTKEAKLPGKVVTVRVLKVERDKALVLKKRHVNQLFIRGDNVIMVGYENSNSVQNKV